MKKCKKHPKYKAIRMPRRDCPDCLAIYKEKNPDPVEGVQIDLLNSEYKDDIKQIKRRYNILLNRYRDLQRVADLLGRVKETSGRIKIKPASKLKKGNSEAVAVIIASDWHVEERVLAAAVGGLNEVNLEICEDRIEHFFRNSLRLLEMFQQDININNIVLALLGDLISNYLHEDQQETNLLPPIEALQFAYEQIVRGIDMFLAHSNCSISIPCCFGNHGRMTKKKRSNNKVGTSLELVIYFWLVDHYRNEPRVAVEIASGSLLYMDILNWKVRFHHGDNINWQGGVGGITIPSLKAIANWNTGRHADLDVFGHWHQYRDLGSFIANGSLIGYSPYSQDIKAPFEPPMQAMFLIDRDRTPALKRPTLHGPVMLQDV